MKIARKYWKIILFVLTAIFIFYLGSQAKDAAPTADKNPATTTQTAEPTAVTTPTETKTDTATAKDDEPATEAPVQAPPAVEAKYNVIAITDGDTIKISVDGKTEPVRLIGVDTPELNATDSVKACEAQNAKNKVTNLISGKSVKIEADDSQGDRDKYNRLLRYIYLTDGTMLNKFLIEQGLGSEYTYKTAYKFQSDFRAAQTSAKTAMLGIWNGATCLTSDITVVEDSAGADQTVALPSATPSDPPKVSYPPPSTTPPDPNCPIKGNISSTGEKIYHIPNGSFYAKTFINESAGEKWFCSENDAIAAGWRKSLR